MTILKKMSKAYWRWRLNLRDVSEVGCDNIPQGMYLRGGKLNRLSKRQCEDLCKLYNIKCVIDLRTPLEIEEKPEVLPEGVDYQHISIVKAASAGITHETGTDPISIARKLRRTPEKLLEMIPDLQDLYEDFMTNEYCLGQLEKAVTMLKGNAEKGIVTLYHCTAGKDRSGVVSLFLLKSYGVSNELIVKDYMKTWRNALLPTLVKCAGIWLITWSWPLTKKIYEIFMPHRKHIETAIKLYKENLTFNPNRSLGRLTYLLQVLPAQQVRSERQEMS